LNSERLKFDVTYTSVLTRAKDSLEIILKEIKQQKLAVTQAWELNERHYGALTGYNKAEMAAKYGKEQVGIFTTSVNLDQQHNSLGVLLVCGNTSQFRVDLDGIR
jgi:2,3-bisphosphoglycerate-dependent phosphoglycerate mutase